MSSLTYFPAVKPSAIIFGTFFNHAASLAVLGPVFGDAYRRARKSNTTEEFAKSSEAASAAAAWGSSLVGSALQSYGVAALLNISQTVTQKGAAYLGLLVFAASSAPTLVSQLVTEQRPLDLVAITAVSRVVETVGLAVALSYFGTYTGVAKPLNNFR